VSSLENEHKYLVRMSQLAEDNVGVDVFVSFRRVAQLFPFDGSPFAQSIVYKSEGHLYNTNIRMCRIFLKLFISTSACFGPN